jgi:branched-chain amino acid transport system substrate-binding protein
MLGITMGEIFNLKELALTGSGAAVAGFIEQYRTGGGAAQLFAHSGAEIEQLSLPVSDEQLQGVAIAPVTPNPYKTLASIDEGIQ